MSTKKRPPSEQTSPDSALTGLVRWFEGQPDGRERFAWVLRDSLDELLDGARTRRWCYQQLNKTEKAHLGGWWRLACADETPGPSPDRDLYLSLSRQMIESGPAV